MIKKAKKYQINEGKKGNVFTALLSIFIALFAMSIVACSDPDINTEEPSGSVKPTHTHTYTSSVVNATCEEDGYTVHVCSICEDSYTDNYVDAIGHNWGEWVISAESTCVSAGEERRDCENCDHYETKSILKKSHDYGEYVSNCDAIFGEDGTKTRKCKTVGCIATETITDEGSAKSIFDFEDGNLHEDYGFTLSGPSGSASIVDLNGNKCVYLNDTSTTSALSMLELDFRTVTADTRFSFKVRFSELGTCTMALTSDEETLTPEVSLVARPNGKLTYFKGSTETEIKDITLNAWISIEININADSSTYDLTVDGIKVDTNVAFRNGGKTVTAMRIGTTKSQKGKIHIDDIYIPIECLNKQLSDVTIPDEGNFTHKEKQTLFNGESTELSDYQYLCFPTVLKLSEEKVIILYRRAPKHYLCHSVLELITYNPQTEQVLSRTEFYNDADINAQNPELMMMPNGDIVCYLDTQKPSGSSATRYGIQQIRSMDGGKTWQITEGLVDDKGIEYGYTFDDVVIDSDVYMMVMTFPELENQGHGRSVHIIKSNDNGSTWIHVKDLNKEFGYSFNESTFELYKNGFFMVLRGDDNVTRAFITDIDCNLISMRSLSESYDCINNIGRPKLFVSNGEYYLMCRNVLTSTSAELALYKFDVSDIEIKKHTQLDKVTVNYTRDTYYAEYYMQEKDGDEYFNVITYCPPSKTDKPNIIRFEYKWSELE